jgi:predicted GIY-YIG superfamily endonuclease
MAATRKLYTLLLEGDHYYVGITTNLEKRWEAHASGKGASWTALHKPVEIIHSEDLESEFDEDRAVKILMHKHGIDKVRGGSYSNPELTPAQVKMLRREITMSTGACILCGEMGHMAKKCPTKQVSCERCGRQGHRKSKCYAKSTATGEEIAADQCFRCGRDGHLAAACYAKTTADGKYIPKNLGGFVDVQLPAEPAPAPIPPLRDTAAEIAKQLSELDFSEIPRSDHLPPKKKEDVCNVM